MNQLNKAIFLDRDGVINDNSIAYYVYRAVDFAINPGVVEVLKKFNEKGYLLIIITNQGGVARKQYTCSDVDNLNKHILATFKSYGVLITDIFYCPHHPEISKCLCRKPNSLLIEKALAIYKIDPLQSFMIGDSTHDVEAAEKLGIKGIKVKSNLNLVEELRKSSFSHLIE